MRRWRLTPTREDLYVWSSAGVRQIQKRVRDFFHPAAPPAEPPAAPSQERRYPRLDLKLPILYRVLGDSATGLPAEVRPYLQAESENVSLLGLCLNLAEQVAPGAFLALTFHVIDRREKFSAVGRVVWSRAAPDPGRHLTGVQFVVVEGDSVVREGHTRLESLIRELEAAPG